MIFILFLMPLFMAYQNNSACLTKEYFDTTQMQCKPCLSNQIGDNTKCKCEDYSKKINIAQLGFKDGCDLCPDGQAVSSDKSHCVPCINFNSTTRLCQCPPLQYPFDVSQTGEQLAQFQCVQCDSNSEPKQSRCQYCGNDKIYQGGKCVCNSNLISAGQYCISQNDRVTYLDGIDNDEACNLFLNLYQTGKTQGKIKNNFIFENFYESALGCIKYKDIKSCQKLANMCVMQQYYELSPVCKLYRKINDNDSLPQIYYDDTKTVNITVKVTRRNSDQQLKYFLKEFDKDGNYIGIKQLTTEFNLCSIKEFDVTSQNYIGQNYLNQCKIKLDKITTMTTHFYELYLQDDQKNLVPVPIEYVNFVVSFGQLPNQSGTNKRYFKRFTIFDSISGQDIGGQSALRVPSYIKINQYLEEGSTGNVYIPILTIYYTDYNIDNIEGAFESDYFYEIKYNMGLTAFWSGIIATFGVANIILVFGIWIIKSYLQMQKNKIKVSKDIKLDFVKQLFIDFLSVWSDIMFWILFLISGYWFIFYKFQSTISVVIPKDEQFDMAFIVIFSLIYIFQFLSNIEASRIKNSFNIYMIDWEQPKIDQNSNESTLSCWRMLLTANKFIDIMADYSFLRIELTFLIFGYFITSPNEAWYLYDRETPLSTPDIRNCPKNRYIQYFLCQLILFIIGVVQISVRKLMIIHRPTRFQDFVDFCAISNISILIFGNNQQGFYIHGSTPGLQAEGTAEDLHICMYPDDNTNKLQHGKQDQVFVNKDRGLFIIFIVFKFFYLPKLFRIIKNYNKQTQQVNILSVGFKNQNDYHMIHESKLEFDQFIRDEIEYVKHHSQQNVKEQFFYQKYFGIFQVDSKTDQEKSIFFMDSESPFIEYAFQDLRVNGNEYQQLFYLVLNYSLWILILDNPSIAILFTYVFLKIDQKIRSYLFISNFSKKTLIDRKFLI